MILAARSKLFSPTPAMPQALSTESATEPRAVREHQLTLNQVNHQVNRPTVSVPIAKPRTANPPGSTRPWPCPPAPNLPRAPRPNSSSIPRRGLSYRQTPRPASTQSPRPLRPPPRLRRPDLDDANRPYACDPYRRAGQPPGGCPKRLRRSSGPPFRSVASRRLCWCIERHVCQVCAGTPKTAPPHAVSVRIARCGCRGRGHPSEVPRALVFRSPKWGGRVRLPIRLTFRLAEGDCNEPNDGRACHVSCP